MNTAGATRKPDKVTTFVGEVMPPERKDQILQSLPAHVKPERFERNLVIAINQHPKLLQCDPAKVFYEVTKAAALGLLLDPQLGEAYLITGWSREDGIAPQLRMGYRGMAKLAKQSGDVKNLYAHEVCEHDLFTVKLGVGKTLDHQPNYAADRGKIYAYYAVVHFLDGTADFEVMSIADIHRIRDRSDGWRAFRDGKIKSTPWATDESEMAKKTVIRRLAKRLPMSPELADAIQIEDDADYRNVNAPLPATGLRARLAAAKSLPPSEGFTVAHGGPVSATTIEVDPDTGELLDAAHEAEIQQEDASTEDHGLADEFGPDDADNIREPDEPERPDPDSPAGILDALKRSLDECTTVAAVDEVKAELLKKLNTLHGEDRKAAVLAIGEAKKRIGGAT